MSSIPKQPEGVSGVSRPLRSEFHAFAASDATQRKGRTPEGGGRSNLTMLDTPKGKDQQSCIDFLVEGVTKLSALEMHRVLQECGYEHQRALADRHIDVLADLMSRGHWQPKSQIDFAILGGRYILINGYHRAYAQVKSGKSITWSIMLHPCKTEGELRSLYFAFDTNIRVRGARDILSAYEFAGNSGLTADMANALYGAVPYIASKFETNVAKKDNLTTKAVDRRLALAGEYAKAAGRYSACLDGLSGSRKKRFLSSAMTAVAVITFRYQSEAAWMFWHGVAQNDGLKRGDPRHALMMDMLSRSRHESKARSVHAFGPSILAWNAFYEERPMQLIRITPESFVARIEGTPFTGKADK